MGRLQLFLIHLGCGGEFKDIALDAKGQAVEQGFQRPILPEALGQAPRPGGARDLEAHHVDLLAEAVQARRAGMAGVALQIELACERGDRIRRRHEHRSDQGHHEQQANEQDSEHRSPFGLASPWLQCEA